MLDPAWYLVGHRHYNSGTIKNYCTDAGLEVKQVMYSGNFWTTLDSLIMYYFKYLRKISYKKLDIVRRNDLRNLQLKKSIFSTNIWIIASKKIK